MDLPGKGKSKQVDLDSLYENHRGPQHHSIRGTDQLYVFEFFERRLQPSQVMLQWNMLNKLQSIKIQNKSIYCVYFCNCISIT